MGVGVLVIVGVVGSPVEVGPIRLQVAAKSARGEGVGLVSCNEKRRGVSSENVSNSRVEL